MITVGTFESQPSSTKWDEFLGIKDVETFFFSEPDMSSIRQWIGYSNCNSCGTTQKKQIFVIDAVVGKTYKISIIPGYISSTIAYSVEVVGAAIVSGSSKSWSAGYKNSISDAWEITFTANEIHVEVKIGNSAISGSNYMYLDAIYLEEVIDPNITTDAWKTSFYALDASGNLLLDAYGFPYEQQSIYHFQRILTPQTTALIVMDAWIDNPPGNSQMTNDHFINVILEKVIPIVDYFAQRHYKIVFLTNDPNTVIYGSQIHQGLLEYVSTGDATVLYHSNFTSPQAFASYFRSRGITNLVYTGFASNVCVLGRPNDGILSMTNQGMKNYFIPEASAAVERPDTWETGNVHIETTNLISQWIGEIINYSNLIGN